MSLLTRLLPSLERCHQLQQISNRNLHQNRLIRHAEKLTHYNIYCFTDWSNREWRYCHLPTRTQNTLGLLFLFLLSLYCQLKNMGGIPWNVSAWKSVPQTKKFKQSPTYSFQTLYSVCTSWCGSKRGCSLLFYRLLMCVGHIRTVLQAPVMSTCLVLTTCLRCVKMGWHQRPKIHRAVA